MIANRMCIGWRIPPYGKLTLEGAGAMPLASLLENKCQVIGKTVLICSGGNIDQPVLDACLNS